MKFLISFAVVLVLILAYFRFFPSAPINPVLPVPQGQEEVNGHNAEVPKGATEDEETSEEGEGHSGASIAPVAPGQTYGASITPDGALPMTALPTALGTRDSAQVKLTGKASAVCQAKGCWMTLPTADGKEMRVRFKDYAFFVPKDLSGHDVVVSGWAHRTTTTVADQQHYLRDAGKSEKEIAAITQPKEEVSFLADGVLVRD
ncbi:DUF4920 domain-containing protein [Hymenobacter convexus]|uniref:DUF4920 domain-containing protein n=1 Tax=Hymenobacter sp. CA1UV-4 TaxID=3063782 RepID=UPI0027133793|nr:DUF4920 domain-containing protein [Hymenobacter sp. CA1UV-4]MDO7852174.1 DUF4920 domain-containing protein [Hymenobacter sp. CA1UV-4]